MSQTESMPIRVAEIEKQFLAAREAPPWVLAGWHSTDPALERMARTLARVLDDVAAHRPEPAYHNRYHTAETVASMALLCGEAVSLGMLADADVALGMLAMLGHDLGHDGSLPPPGVLEAISADRTARLAAGLPHQQIIMLRQVITATDPTQVLANRRRAMAADATALDHLCRLANEADVLASLLPDMGWRLAGELAEEWVAHDPVRASDLTTFVGRRNFLLLYQPVSEPAARLGLAQNLAAQIAAFMPQGPHQLDRLPRDEAMRRYRGRLTALLYK